MVTRSAGSGEPLVLLLARARAAGVALTRPGKGTLDFQAPDGAAELAALLRKREPGLLASFDWRGAGVAEPAPCLLCGRPALLRDPAERAPAHKMCVDALLSAL
jgi:hypothetical protein